MLMCSLHNVCMLAILLSMLQQRLALLQVAEDAGGSQVAAEPQWVEEGVPYVLLYFKVHTWQHAAHLVELQISHHWVGGKSISRFPCQMT